MVNVRKTLWTKYKVATKHHDLINITPIILGEYKDKIAHILLIIE